MRTLIEQKCERCKKDFSAVPAAKRRFCSKSCASIIKRTEKPSFVKGMTAWNKGLTGYHAGEQHHYFGKKRPDLSGERHPRYISDRTKLMKKNERNDYAYVNWRREVWKRDGFKCKIADEICKGRIEAHHILGWKEYPELRYIVNNGITLCHAHHPFKKADEAKLSPYFQSLVAKIN